MAGIAAWGVDTGLLATVLLALIHILAGLLLGAVSVPLVAEAGVGARKVLATRVPTGV